jgi:hypothetical protein
MRVACDVDYPCCRHDTGASENSCDRARDELHGLRVDVRDLAGKVDRLDGDVLRGYGARIARLEERIRS